MKKLIKKSTQDFQAVKLAAKDLKQVKGGSDPIIVQDVMEI